MGFFSLNSSQWELSVVYQRIFSISYRFRDIRGQRGPKCDLWGSMKYSFFIQFWWDFFHWIPLNESFQNCYSRFFLSLTIFEIQGAQKGKNAIFEATSKFYFLSDFDGIFSLDSSEWELSKLFSRFFLSLTVFEIQGTQKGKNITFSGM